MKFKLKSRDVNYLKVKYKKIILIKFKLKYLILKSIFFNRNIKSLKRSSTYLYLNDIKPINKRYYNICRYTNYSKSINKFIGYGRHELNRNAILGKLQNININSW